MAYNIDTSSTFDKSVRRLAKKYLSIVKDIVALTKILKEAPHTGILLKENTYKIRMAISSKNKGKSGGARVVTYVIDANETVILLDIYDKSDQDNISDSYLQELIDEIE